MDYRIFNVRTFPSVRIHTGVGGDTPTTSQHHFLTPKLNSHNLFLCFRTVIEPMVMESTGSRGRRSYQLSHHVHRTPCLKFHFSCILMWNTLLKKEERFCLDKSLLFRTNPSKKTGISNTHPVTGKGLIENTLIIIIITTLTG